MTIASEITKLQTNLSNCYTVCRNKSATIPANENFDNLANCINSISGGGGGGATLITKNITANGTYNASSDYADGYSSVTVNVQNPSSVGITREVSNGKFQMPSSSFTYSLPSTATDLGNDVLYYAFKRCRTLTSVDFSSLTKVTGYNAMYGAFQDCTGITSVDLSNVTEINNGYAMAYAFKGCSNLTTLDLSSLVLIGGDNINTVMSGAFENCTSLSSIDLSSLQEVRYNGLSSVFKGCTSLTSVTFDSLTTLKMSRSLNQTFRGCTSLTSISFPALTSTSFGNATNQFNNMLQGVTGCTVHFPSNLQSVIGSWADVTAGFGGTNTTVSFDLAATT